MTDQQRKDLVMGQTRKILSNLQYIPDISETLDCLRDIKSIMFIDDDIELTIDNAQEVIDNLT